MDKESELVQFTPESEKGQARKKKGRKKRLRKYTPLDDDEYTTLEKGQRAKADRELVTYHLRDKCIKEYELDLIILDEAQCLRHTSDSYSNLLRLFNWRRLLFVTGTPIAGSLRDLLSPLTLIAHTNSVIEGLSKLPSVVSKPAVEKFEFDMLICDEAQFMRRASGSYSNLVRLIKWEKLSFVTGAPMASSLRDVLSPLTLIRHINPLILAFQGLCLPPVLTFLVRLPSLLHSGYNPTIEFNEIEENQPCRGVYHDTFMEVIQNWQAQCWNCR